jgi:glycosyltransferase involved in cell wall biosynthesis
MKGMASQEEPALAHPLVTVITATKNSFSFLPEAVESVLQQDFDNWEYVIVDDGSTDETQDYLRTLTDPRIQIVRMEKSVGPAKARNTAIRKARGELIAVLDADDVAHPSRLRQQVQFLERNPDCGVCGSWARVFGRYESIKRFPQRNYDLRGWLLFGNPLVHSTVMIRTAALPARNSVYRHELVHAEDYEMWVEVSKKWKIANIPEVLVDYRSHHDQISAANTSQAEACFMTARNDLLTHLGLPQPKTPVLNFAWLVAALPRNRHSAYLPNRHLVISWLRNEKEKIRNQILDLSRSVPLLKAAVALGRRMKIRSTTRR